MGRAARALSLGVIVALAGCGAPTRLVEVPTAVTVEGPVRFRPIAADLLTCPGKPEALADGISGRVLIERAQAWQAFSACLESRLVEIGRLSSEPAARADGSE